MNKCHQALWGDQGDGTYLNPVLASDYCDPDVIRVGEIYYMISSTMQLSPGMVILESRDLVNWRTISYAIPNLEELNPDLNWDRMSAYNEGVYAGSIRYLEWKERKADGTLIEKSKWFVHACLCNHSFVVSTADEVTGPWNAVYMTDRNGMNLVAQPGGQLRWADTCPYWEKNEDGTLKAAYFIVSKIDAWYPRLFLMSLDGTQLLDGDIRFMRMPGDTTRARTGHTPLEAKGSAIDSGDPLGEVLDKRYIEIIPTSKAIPDAYSTSFDEYGNSKSILYAEHIPNREGTVIWDVFTAEGAKIFRFDPETQIGQTTFSGRGGSQEAVADYMYIYNNEVWDGQRLPVLHRARSIYGDKYDDKGNYIAAGTAADPGSYETQRLMVNLTEPVNTWEPNQGAFIDVPPHMSEDGLEHWYWITQQGNERVSALGRPTSLLPVNWIDGWPMPGLLDDQEDYWSAGEADPAANVYDGTGLNGSKCHTMHHPHARLKPGSFVWQGIKPPIKGKHPILRFQDSDDFQSERLSPNWQWNYAPRPGYWSLTEQPGRLRLYAFATADGSDNFFKAGNTICQRYVQSNNAQIEIKLDISNMMSGQEGGIAHFNGGVQYSSFGIKRDNQGWRLAYNGVSGGRLEDASVCISLRSVIDVHKVNRYFYSVDEGRTYHLYGEAYQLAPGGYKGDYIGIYTYNNAAAGKLGATEKPGENYAFGYIEVLNFKYD
ncbi:family 43 glycosylhydrolase [Paenibacillus sp. HB172176]|uniref:beta-xylosidase family glycoside hydrolase n=1 Tax=Paenibacillus sp. HB172176 TaxID=2493690 RepID=UPI0014390B88|nr:family 43 glycosylhydrolase [Paenibacillus sp. HB172176]